MNEEYKRALKNRKQWSQLYQNEDFMNELEFRIKAVSHANEEGKRLYQKHKETPDFINDSITLNKQEFLRLIVEIEACDDILPRAYENFKKALAKLDLIYLKLYEEFGDQKEFTEGGDLNGK
tara:strand:- start:13559 stop:13924 length:366 start_codon:yes stop_codon:yes gene_type:complete